MINIWNLRIRFGDSNPPFAEGVVERAGGASHHFYHGAWRIPGEDLL